MVEKNGGKFRIVQVPHSSSYLPNNLSASQGGKHFVTLKNTEKGSIVLQYGSDLVEKASDVASPQSTTLPDHECAQVKLINF